jgi:hypothetical protein
MRVRPYGGVWTLGRPIALAAALHVLIGLGIVSAQTVVVRNAPPNTTIEFVLNGTVTATATAGADGLATLPVSKGGLADRATMDAFVWVDECSSVRRVLVLNYVQQPPPADGCRRTQIPGLFLLQRITTLLIDLDPALPAIRVRQGPLPDEWLRPPSPSGGAAPRISIAPRGAILFGGGESASLGSVLEPACGDVTNCSADNRALSFAGGLSYWFSQYIAAEGSYVRPKVIAANGAGDRFRFDSDMEGGFVVFAAKGGFPLGRFRLFGTVGANYHRATFTTNETIDDRTATVGGVSQTIPGGTTTLQWRTEGWGPVFGGGTEVWLTSSIGFFGEFSRLGMKGADEGIGEASTDAMITAIIFGGRYRIGGR